MVLAFVLCHVNFGELVLLNVFVSHTTEFTVIIL